MIVEPRWIKLARTFIGLRETKGAEHSPEILQFWKDMKRGGIKSDEVPWCSGFVGAMLERSGIQSSRYESAKSYLTWGEVLPEPVHGCIVIFSRDGGGHVGFVVGRAIGGGLLVLGGNQSDEVNIKTFPLDRVAGYRWPAGEELPTHSLALGNAATSKNEA